MNIVQRVGGALGGALFAVVIARNLPDDPEGAFRHAFWLIALTGLLGLLSALWLHHALRGAEQSGRTGSAPRPGGGSAPVEPGAGVLEDA
ncbi:hypothetical protein MXD61_20645 [Frankia sp. AgPm24]|uniref:hypothetical protein n=1 Tax=Frankia sp. AgPm24 TaxID=631128 RepID=UPI00200C8C76|nr:hypothetical protein [Frankia sp. AgPm24]MCK9924245.1 hypothetical protein [Frankia sp. AgPm24]